VRRHLYLITDHPTEDYIGKVEAREAPYQRAEKNVERPVDKLNIDTGERCEVSIVGLGYHDFADRDDYDERFKPVVDRKLREVDQQHLDKAGIEVDREVVTDGGEDYEYRVTGVGRGSWLRTDWVDKAQALSDYERAREEWAGLVGFERRVSGDDSTIQRKPKPSTGEWNDVTDDDIHFVDEEVTA